MDHSLIKRQRIGCFRLSDRGDGAKRYEQKKSEGLGRVALTSRRLHYPKAWNKLVEELWTMSTICPKG